MPQSNVFHSLDSLVAKAASLRPGVPQIISIDGVDGSGKSTLAERLASRISAVHIEVDEFREKHQGSYLNSVRYPELKKAIEDPLARGRIILVDSVCVLQILERIRMTPTRTIYVKRITGRGLWCPYPEFRFDSAEGALNALGPNSPLLLKEIVKYHIYLKPHERADLIFENRESDFAA